MAEYIYARVRRSDPGFRAECLNLPVQSDGVSLDDAVEKLHAAIHSFLNKNDLALFGFHSAPKVLVSLHLGPPDED
jgi:hypothetical protein